MKWNTRAIAMRCREQASSGHGRPKEMRAALIDAADALEGVGEEYRRLAAAYVDPDHNALAGIPDPAAALRAAREALSLAEAWMIAPESNGDQVLDAVRAALSMLTPQEHPPHGATGEQMTTQGKARE